MESRRFHGKDYEHAVDAVRAVADKIESDLEEAEALANHLKLTGQADVTVSTEPKGRRMFLHLGDGESEKCKNLIYHRRFRKRAVCLAVCFMFSKCFSSVY